MMTATQAPGLSGAIPFEEPAQEADHDVDVPRAATAPEPESSTGHDPSAVPVKQVLRWQDDGGALLPPS
jgi:hypothetical protein